jgi:hypothetical protein
MLPYEHPKRIMKTVSMAPVLPADLSNRYIFRHAAVKKPAAIQTPRALLVTIGELLKEKKVNMPE